MSPTETTVETGISQSQSHLRTASSEYCDLASASGWVKTGGGIFGLADTLINGAKDDMATPDTYAAKIGATTDAPALVLARIMRDAETATTGLADVTRVASAVLAGQVADGASRGDVMSFERALVRAQMSHRSFLEALQAVSERSDMELTEVDRQLNIFADTIDEATGVADTLADKYASLGTITS